MSTGQSKGLRSGDLSAFWGGGRAAQDLTVYHVVVVRYGGTDEPDRI